MKLLLHVCCGPCTAGTMMSLAEENLHPVLYWNNPNIHPFTEYRARLEGLRTFADQESIPLVIDGDYGLRDFLRETSSQPESRCRFCYEVRLAAAAEYASKNGFDAFSTTLFVSPYQNHALIAEVGNALAKERGIDFLVRDFRPHFRDGQQKARQMELYMQKYCGCVYSEEDRYADKKGKIRKGYFANFPQSQIVDSVS